MPSDREYRWITSGESSRDKPLTLLWKRRLATSDWGISLSSSSMITMAGESIKRNQRRKWVLKIKISKGPTMIRMKMKKWSYWLTTTRPQLLKKATKMNRINTMQILRLVSHLLILNCLIGSNFQWNLDQQATLRVITSPTRTTKLKLSKTTRRKTAINLICKRLSRCKTNLLKKTLTRRQISSKEAKKESKKKPCCQTQKVYQPVWNPNKNVSKRS